MYTDPSGEFWHIVVGAVVGGVINLAVKAFQGEINSWGDGFAAFGIGAVAGGLGAATGGAAFAAVGGAAAGGGGFLAGAVGGMAGAAISSPIQSYGNHLYFGDPLLSPRQYVTGIAIGGVLGGTINGGIALYNGKSFWTGSILTPRYQIEPISVLQKGIKDNPFDLETTKIQIKQAVPDNGQPIQYKAEYLKKVVGIDGQHTWNRSSIEIVSDNGKIFNLIGKDDKSNILIQMLGKHHGTDGVFEIIISNGVITHQRFIPGGIINGIPNQVVPGVPGSVKPSPTWWK